MRIASSGHQHYRVLDLLGRFVLFLSRFVLEKPWNLYAWVVYTLCSERVEKAIKETSFPIFYLTSNFSLLFALRHHPPNTHTCTHMHTRVLKGRWASVFILDLCDIFRTVGFSALSIPIYFLTSRSIEFSHRVISPSSPFYDCELIPFCTFILLM